MHQVAIVGPTKSMDTLTNYLNIFIFFSVYFNIAQEHMCNAKDIDVSVMSLWTVYHIDSENCCVVCWKLSYSIFLSSLESHLLLENKEAIQTAE